MYSSTNQAGLEVLVLKKMDISFQNSNLGNKSVMVFLSLHHLSSEDSDPGELVVSASVSLSLDQYCMPSRRIQEAYL